MDLHGTAVEIMRNEPLGLPRGSVRSILAIGLLLLLGLTILYDIPESSIAVVAGLTGSATTHYFNRRQEETVDE